MKIYFTNLRKLYINDGNLNSLYKFRYLSGLSILDISDNNIRNLDGIERLNNLKKLFLVGNPIEDIEALKVFYRNNNKLDYLTIPAGKISPKDIKYLKSKFKKSSFDGNSYYFHNKSTKIQ